MSYDGHIKIDTAIDGKGFQTGLQKISGIASKVLGTATKIVGGVGAALGGAAVAGVKYNAQMEQYITSFGTMLGGADKAQALVSQLKKYAAATPFEFSDLAKGTQTLLSFGVSSKDVMGDLKMLGDVSQGNKERFDALTLAFAQVGSAGKMQGQDLLQFVNAGFNPLNEMAKKSGKSMAELRDEMQKGKISSQDVADAFKSATSKGGQFYGAMEAQSKTFSGQLSTLKDNVSQFLGELTNGLENSLKDTALPMVNGWMDQLQKAFSTGGVNGVVAAFGNVLAQAVTAIAQKAPQIINMGVSLIQSFISGLEQNSTQIANSAYSIISALISGIISLLPTLGSLALKLVLALAQNLTDHADQIVSGATQLMSMLVSGLIQAAPQLAQAAVKLAAAFYTALMQQNPPAGIALTLFGAFKGLSGTAKLFGGIADGMDKISKAGGLIGKITGPIDGIVGSVGKMSGVFSKVTSGISVGFKLLGSSVSSFFSLLAANPIILIIAGVVALVAAIVYLWNTNEGFRNAVIGAWNAIVSTAQNVFGAIAGFFTNTLPAAWNSVVSFFNGIPAWWVGLWTQVGQFFTDIWNSIIGFFTTTIPAWIASIGQWFQQLPYNLGLILGMAVAAVMNFGTSVWNWITVTLPQIINGIVQWFQQLPGRIWTFLVQIVTSIGTWGTSVWTAATTWVSNTVNAIIQWFQQLPGRIWTFLVQVVTNIGNWGSNMWNYLSAEIPKIISGIGNWFAQLPGRVWNFLSQVIQNVASWGSSMWSSATSAASSVVNGIVNFFSDLPGNMLNIGKNIIYGIWNGIKSGASWLWGKITGFCNSFVDGFKRGLGIHSPSKLFADEVGKFVPPGISVGMDKAMPGTISNMRAQISGMMDQARAAISAEQARVGASFGASVQYQVALAGGYGTNSAPAYAGPSTVKTQIYFDRREVATAIGPAISEQNGWEEDH